MNNMTVNRKMQINKDLDNKKMTITRSFDAPISDVWRAWTESELLDQWWAPKPWKAETKSMDFSVGGYWLYAMVGPDNTKHWARMDYTEINPVRSFSAKDSFCDDKGNRNKDLPVMDWNVSFHESETGTKVNVVMKFEKETDIEKIIEMGFEEGFAAALTNLDHYLSTQFRLRKENKT